MPWTTWLPTWRVASPRTGSHRNPGTSPRRTSLAVEPLEDRCLLAGGVLDPTFGAAGLVSTNLGSDARAFAVATYPNMGNANDGKIVAAGDAFLPKARTYTMNMAVVRYNLDGTLDSTFAGAGKVTTPLGIVMAVQVQPDGKVVAAGRSGEHFAVVRYNANGAPDTTFGSGGMVITTISKNSYDFIEAMVLQSDGKIVVAGETTPSRTSNRDVALVRYNANGALDASFGTGGIVTTHLPTPVDTHWDQRGVTLALDPNPTPLDPHRARFVVGARVAQAVPEPVTQAGTVIVRYNANGALDAGFGSTGFLNLGPSLTNAEVAVQTDHSIVVAGSVATSFSGSQVTGIGFSLKRLKPDGTLDASFGSGGVEVTSSPNYCFANSVAVQQDGRILVAGQQTIKPGTDKRVMVARYDIDGGLDTTFGANGIIAAGAVSDSAVYPAMALEPDGRIVIAYSFGAFANFELARILAAGPQVGSFTASPDPVTAGSTLTLSAAGVVALNPGGSVTRVAFCRDADGDGRLTASDTLLGYGILTSPRTWSFTFSTAGLTAGETSFFAVAEDSFGVLGDPFSITATVI